MLGLARILFIAISINKFIFYYLKERGFNNLANTNKKLISTRIQNKHDLEVNWKKATGFIPLAGEWIIYDKEVDSEGNTLALPEGRTTAFTYERFKIGDGVTPINDLAFALKEYTKLSEFENDLDIITPEVMLSILDEVQLAQPVADGDNSILATEENEILIL